MLGKRATNRFESCNHRVGLLAIGRSVRVLQAGMERYPLQKLGELPNLEIIEVIQAEVQ